MSAHQNVKLLFEPMRRRGLLPPNVDRYQDLIKQMICDTPTEMCHRNTCEKCSSFTPVMEKISKIIEENLDDEFSFQPAFMFKK